MSHSPHPQLLYSSTSLCSSVLLPPFCHLCRARLTPFSHVHSHSSQVLRFIIEVIAEWNLAVTMIRESWRAGKVFREGAAIVARAEVEAKQLGDYISGQQLLKEAAAAAEATSVN